MGDWAGYLTLILDGAWVTVRLTVMGAAVALVFAFLAGLGRLSRHAAVRWLATAYIEFFRGTSIFVQLFWIYFVLPLTGVTLTPMQAGVMALGLNVGAYGAEVVRGAILSVPRDQYEATTALNLTRWQRMRHVILPQALPLMVPTFGNNAIELLKATSVVSLISLSDMTFQAQVVRSQTGNTLIPFVTVLVIYFALSMTIAAAVGALERRHPRAGRGALMDWDWSFAWSIMPQLLAGVRITILATILGAAVAAVLGLVFAILRRSPNRWIARPTAFVVQFIRGTPLLVQLYFIFYVLPDIGIRLPALAAGVLGMGLHYATYAAEVYRGGIEAVPRGQWEAARATNLTARQTWVHVILPQALPPMIPAMANYLLAMFKETPLLSAITVLELMNQARSAANFSYRYVEPMTLVGVFFLVISLISVAILRWLERRYARRA
ncbi:ectoine/hydroxyectoine ABC transporter permease subunit EhuD [Paracoccus sanguinis]|uniref:Ectoine/hydroxyectoine ABC transporter, permease protein EhuD/ectoine/hydroxyectoine ABC transporter, permease protein EhuC,TIGR03004 n=1 Tax=Paracoccus sanguinis TaxID=1545044 RepID=A0A1H2ZTL2_9RHOB|nr:ectoine/hydroxyectoine ABC transporter permease subunit EhuD [Paracoccus sanguinis]SDX20188.1 ectoine/hydroxyectoine ABC transporter, permease protein EhuD/ectoine/hydroxyectoine ABC transporter, permease protein EhuC,TIGR03004 [Paracoccus sanguinis]